MPAEQTNIKVAVRVRPYNQTELEQNQRQIIKVLDKSTLLFDPDEEDDEFFFQGTKQNYRDITKRVHKKVSMEFDRVFDPEASNMQIFQECTAPLIDSVLNGYNCSVFVYGATGAGKTFTMLGSHSCAGLTFLTMRDLFNKIQSQSETKKFDVGVSYLEVYNEHVMNLLTKTGPLKLREDANGVVVSGLVLKPIYSAEELLELLALGNSNRTQHPTDANAESSRSHAIFQVHIRMTERSTGTKRTVKLSMIDLAGSERAASTKGIGIRFKEGASINKSLLALGNCINKLADGLKHIPYRDSNLTRILKDSLGGNCQTLMVANVSMSSLTYEDTYNTLKYASRAKKIRTTLKQNVLKSNMPKDFYIKKVTELMSENERLKENSKSLELKVSQLGKTAAATRSYDESELKNWYSKIDAVYSSVIKSQEYVIGTRSKIKNLNFREKLRKDNIAHQQMLTLSKTKLPEDFSLFTTSASNVEKQVVKLNEELTRWRKKLQNEYRDLEKLKKEIKDSKHVDILQIYQRSKDLELQNSVQRININHISTLNAEVVRDTEKLRQAFSMACELLQKSYEQLSSEQRLDGSNLAIEFEQLQQHMQSHALLLKNDQYPLKDSDEELEMPAEVNILLNGKRLHESSDIGSMPSCSTTKRSCLKRWDWEHDLDLGLETLEDTDSDDCSMFKKPKVRTTKTTSSNLNETQVLSKNETDDESLYKMIRKKEMVSNILSEQVARVPTNKDFIKSVLVKSKNFNHQGLLKTVAAGVQKENKKYSPVRIRKSPRSVMVKALTSGGGSSTKKKNTVRGANAHGEPVVRINRAASFRVKK